MSEHPINQPRHGAPLSGKVVLSPLVLLLLGIGSPIVGSVIKDRLIAGQDSAAVAAQVQMLQDRVTRLEDGKASKDELLIFERDVRSDLKDLKADVRELKDVMIQKQIAARYHAEAN